MAYTAIDKVRRFAVQKDKLLFYWKLFMHCETVKYNRILSKLISAIL